MGRELFVTYNKIGLPNFILSPTIFQLRPILRRPEIKARQRHLILILFSGNRQIPGLATGAVGHSLLYSRR